MTAWLWWGLVFLHVMAAAFWVGGQLMLVVVVLPLLRRGLTPAQVRELSSAAGRRFAVVSNRVLLPLLVASGLGLAWLNGVRFGNLLADEFGRVLLVKAALVALVFALAAAHGGVARRFRGPGVRLLAMATLLISVAIVGLGVALATVA